LLNRFAGTTRESQSPSHKCAAVTPESQSPPPAPIQSPESSIQDPDAEPAGHESQPPAENGNVSPSST
jgi:hypothetical protein